MTNLIHIAHLISAAWAAAGELITATAILATLNVVANSIRWTYKAGATTGRLLWPAIHWTADVIRQIDWRYAATVALECAVAVAVICWVTLKWSHKALIAASATLGRLYAALIATEGKALVTVTPRRRTVMAPAFVHPLAELATELEQLTRRELQELTGSKRKAAKRELAAQLIAC